MKERSEGTSGRPLLIDTLLKQDIVRYDASIASALADVGEVLECASGQELVHQDGTDNDVYFLLAGEANVLVNDRFIGARLAGTCIGEMAATGCIRTAFSDCRSEVDRCGIEGARAGVPRRVWRPSSNVQTAGRDASDTATAKVRFRSTA